MRLQQLASLRYLRRHRAQCALAIAGIALGVAIVVAIQLVQLAARAAFDQALRGVFGDATHVIHATTPRFDEHVLATVRRVAAGLTPRAVLEGGVHVQRADGGMAAVRLLGTDLLALPPTTSMADHDAARLLLERGAVVASAALAQRLGIAAGDALPLTSGTTLQVVAIDTATGAAGEFLLADIATAQEVLGASGRLSRIELTVPVNAGPASPPLDALAAALPPRFTLAPTGAAAAGGNEMTRAFYTNLDALSLLAVLVGGFMIYNTMTFFVVQRTTLFARLRALGVTRRALALQVAFEAAVLGACGGVLGDALGVLLAHALAAPMAQTLADHYQGHGLGAVTLSPLLAAAGLALAVVTTLVAAIEPAWQAASQPPRAALSHSARRTRDERRLRHARVASALCVLIGLGLLSCSARSLLAGFGALASLLLAAMLVTPDIVAHALGLLDRLAGKRLPLPERVALKSANHALGRVGLAVAALMAATATSIGVGLMVASFRVAVSDWLGQLLRADYYLAQEGTGSEPHFGPDLAARVAELPGVAAVSRVRRLESGPAGARHHVTAYDLPAVARKGFRFVAGDPVRAWPDWQRGAAVLVSEPYAWHHRLAVGERLTLGTPDGALRLPIAGIYRDYGDERGVIAISWSLYRAHWRDERAHGLGVYPGRVHSRAQLRAELERLAASLEEVSVWSRDEVHARSLGVFDRTFAVTDVLTLVAAVVAALGMFNALLALHFERAREYAMLRANGFSRNALARTLLAQTGYVGVAAVTLAVPAGVAIAELLIEVINVRSFGWSMAFSWHAAAFVLPAVLALGAALAATVYPALRAVTVAPARALRQD